LRCSTRVKISIRKILVPGGLLLLLLAPSGGMAVEPSPSAVAAFDSYVRAVEARLAEQHCCAKDFLAGASLTRENEARLRLGELIVEPVALPSGAAPAGALLVHWRGTAFVSGSTVADFRRLMQDLDDYPRYFTPQVLQARVLNRDGDHLQTTMRVMQHHVLTVTMDTTYDIMVGHRDAQHGYSLSRSIRITEIGPNGRALEPNQEHGFLWRLNTYWSYEERDDGLYIQIETISLTRSIPAGLGWLVGSYVQSIPRESLEFTLRATCNALRQTERK
jgi:hypothetical protein